MNLYEVINMVSKLIEQHRIDIGERPKITPVAWKGLKMTVEEAELAIQKLEADKLKYQSAMNKTQASGEITKLVAGGAGLATMVTGVATLIAGLGVTGVGQTVGDGVRDIGTNSNAQVLRQIGAYIDSIKNAMIKSI